MSDNGRNGFDQTPEGVVAFLESLLESEEPLIDHTPIFVQYLDDEDPQVRATAVRGLWNYPDPEFIDPLMDLASNDQSEFVRAQAISVLGMYVHEGVLADYEFDFGPMGELMDESDLPEADFDRVKEYLLAVWADEDRSLDERRFAVEGLSFLGAEVAHLIEELYHRPEREMKISALFAMGRSGLVRWREILAQELHNEDPEFQFEAVRAVGAIGMDELGEDVLQLTYSEDRDIMLQAVEALGQTGWEGGFDRLDELANDPDPEVAEVADDALGEWFLIRDLDASDDLDEDWDDEVDADWSEDV
jgi:HEAT repeat protein